MKSVFAPLPTINGGGGDKNQTPSWLYRPRETLPGVLYILSNVFPVTYFIPIARGIIVRGAGFFDLLPNAVALLIIAAALLTLATVRFRKSVELMIEY